MCILVHRCYRLNQSCQRHPKQAAHCSCKHLVLSGCDVRRMKCLARSDDRDALSV
uniref:Uncharacterized protein n=1 Tax=Anguilla anguilla TaxID=7936 RepID=A0A0E9R4N7_ANGAN